MITAGKGRSARQKHKRFLTQAQEAIQNEKRAAVNELREQVGTLSPWILQRKVLQKELESKDKQVQLVNQLLGRHGS